MALVRRRLSLVVLVASIVLLLAGCGSAHRQRTTAAPRSSAARSGNLPSYQRQQLAAAECIRHHGVPKLPDPTFGGGSVNMSTPAGMLTSPAFFRAERECAKKGLELAGYSPVSTATPAEMAQALSVARCMRAHAVPNWPDPVKTLPSNLHGAGVQDAVPGPPGGPMFVIPKSIDIESPAVKHAAKACHED